MAIPAGISKVKLTFGLYFDPAGHLLRDERIYIECPDAPIKSAAGDVVVSSKMSVMIQDGTAEIELVATDAAGLSKSGFQYKVTLPSVIGAEPVSISLPSSVPSVDFDMLIPGISEDGPIVYFPPTTDESIAGFILDPSSEAHAAVVSLAGTGGSGEAPAGRELTFTNLATWSTSYTGRRPNVAIYINGEQVETDVYASNGTISATFPAPATGTLVLS